MRLFEILRILAQREAARAENLEGAAEHPDLVAARVLLDRHREIAAADALHRIADLAQRPYDRARRDPLRREKGEDQAEAREPGDQRKRAAIEPVGLRIGVLHGVAGLGDLAFDQGDEALARILGGAGRERMRIVEALGDHQLIELFAGPIIGVDRLRDMVEPRMLAGIGGERGELRDIVLEMIDLGDIGRREHVEPGLVGHQHRVLLVRGDAVDRCRHREGKRVAPRRDVDDLVRLRRQRAEAALRQRDDAERDDQHDCGRNDDFRHHAEIAEALKHPLTLVAGMQKS